MTQATDSTEPTNFLRFCPHCGNAQFIARSPRQFLCEGCGFNFFINASAAVVALIKNNNNQLLLVRRDRQPAIGQLDLPGGFVDPGESIEDALRREIHEELGVSLLNARYLCSAPNEYIFSGFKVRTSDIAFECQVDHTPTHASDDVRSLEWTPIANVRPADMAFSSIREIVSKYVQSQLDKHNK